MTHINSFLFIGDGDSSIGFEIIINHDNILRTICLVGNSKSTANCTNSLYVQSSCCIITANYGREAVLCFDAYILQLIRGAC